MTFGDRRITTKKSSTIATQFHPTKPRSGSSTALCCLVPGVTLQFPFMGMIRSLSRFGCAVLASLVFNCLAAGGDPRPGLAEVVAAPRDLWGEQAMQQTN